jgi:hypothetical protein
MESIEAMQNGEIAILAGGTGNLFLQPTRLRRCEELKSKPMPCLRERAWTVFIRLIPKKNLRPSIRPNIV